MKSILYSACIGTLALALTAGGAQAATDKNKRQERAKPQHRSANVQAARPASTGRSMAPHRDVSAAQSRQRSYAKPRTSSNAVVKQNTGLQGVRERNFARNERMRERNAQRKQEFRARRDVAANRDQNVSVNRDRNVAINRDRNFAFNRRSNFAINNNFRSDAFSGQQYAVFRNYHREWHDRGWWRGHCDRIVFVSGGWYYWNAGYWFPAWGYDPYAYYAYDGPIYAYNGLTPDQVTVDVQLRLQRAGYYDGPVDGILGQMTQEAIAAFQADNGLAVTAAIDEPTLATLGLA